MFLRVSETLSASSSVLTDVSPDSCFYHVTDTTIIGTPTVLDTPAETDVTNATSTSKDTTTASRMHGSTKVVFPYRVSDNSVIYSYELIERKETSWSCKGAD